MQLKMPAERGVHAASLDDFEDASELKGTQHPVSAWKRRERRAPVEFIAVCVLVFVASVSATAYFCHLMCCEMEMPGGWTMSTMWMRMPGQTWFASAVSFLLMWLAMMVAMMMPSALPTFLKTKHQWTSLCSMASGYFATWLAAGVGIYALGVAFAAVAMRSELFSRAVPLLLGASLIGAGVIQFTRWKMTHLLRCRSPFGCAISCPQHETSFRLGCRQGAACCLCCAAPMTIQLALGIMNPLVMIIVAIVIAAEKLLPRPAIGARLVGISAIIAGVVFLDVTWFP
jgi:predicted metal-binding membrane protein